MEKSHSKKSTRHLMTEDEKARTIDAVLEARNHLIESVKIARSEVIDAFSMVGLLSYCALFDRAEKIMRGFYFSRNQKTIARWFQVRRTSRSIAEETGAEFQDVFDLMEQGLSRYVGDD